jgi:hypothetical protein
LVKNSLKVREVDLQGIVYEITAVDLCGTSGLCRLVCAYRQPDMSFEDTVCFLQQISSLTDACKSVVICGDFNIPKMCWNPLTGREAFSNALLNFMFVGGFTQFVREITHRGGNILDLVFGSDEQLVNGVSINPSFSDHFSVFFNLCFRTCNTGDRPAMRNYNHCTDLNYFLGYLNWDLIFCDCHDHEDVWRVFSDALKFGIEHFVPFFPQVRNRKGSQFGLSTQTQNARAQKLFCYKNYKRFRTLFWKDCLRFWTKRVSRLVKADQFKEEAKIADSTDQKRFFKYVKGVLGRTSVIPDIVSGGVIYSDPIAKANVFNDYFSSVFTIDDGFMPSFRLRTSATVSRVIFSTERIVIAFKKLASSFSSGPDDIPSVLLKNCTEQLLEPLRRLFTVVFDYGIPTEWLRSDVVPLYKGSGSTSSVESYRPISMRASVFKLMEVVVKDVILDHFVSNKLLVCEQHGFVPRKSTVTELLECISEWACDIDNNYYVDVVFIDLRKAFDSVVHSKLLYKCEMYGITGNLLAFLRNFLSNAFQRVKIDESFSEWRSVSSGVPQGSVLGPLLFLIYINDMPEIFGSCRCKLYADDSKLFKALRKDSTHAPGLQRDLTSLQIWCDLWQLTVNVRKCAVLKLGLRRPDCVETYCFSGVEIPVVSDVKDLGVHLSCNFSFSHHCNIICNRASSRVGIIHRAFECRSLAFMRKMYVSYVRPILEYASEVWSPLNLEDIDKIERIQRRYTKRILGLSDLSYAERLELCDLEPLELRRLHADLKMTYKIVRGLVDLSFHDFFSYAPFSSNRGNSLKLYPKQANSNTVLNCFNYRVIHIWNSLPDEVVTAVSLTSFSTKLKDTNSILRRFLRGRAL